MAPSWNFSKADWKRFKERLETRIGSLILTDNIDKDAKSFTTTMLGVAKETIPRGKRRNYQPYWTETLEKLHNEVKKARNTYEKTPQWRIELHIIRPKQRSQKQRMNHKGQNGEKQRTF